jgi:hypothetical protein
MMAAWMSANFHPERTNSVVKTPSSRVRAPGITLRFLFERLAMVPAYLIAAAEISQCPLMGRRRLTTFTAFEHDLAGVRAQHFREKFNEF